MLNGTPLDWALQEAVALIPDEIWKAGPERVAEEIARIEAEFLARKLPLAEEIRFNPETGRFRVDPVAPKKPALLAATLRQVADALEDVLAAPSNGLHERSREVRVLRRVLARYGNDPQRIEMDFTSVHGGLVRQVASEELPDSEENKALIEALATCTRGIRGTDPEIAENRRILNEQAFAELPTEVKANLAVVEPALVVISEEVLAEDFATDIPGLINDAIGPVPRNAPPLPGVVRTFNRVSQIALLLRKSPEIVDRLDRSTGYNTNGPCV